MAQFVDDKYMHLEADIDKIREKYRMYISFSNQLAAKAVVLEILFNALDECRNPRSPGSKIDIEYHEDIDTITIRDNGRGIPTNVLEMVLTTLNSGSNIDSGSKNSLETDTLGRNGVGTLAMTALGEFTEVTTYRGGTENMMKRITFREGKKVDEEVKPCDASNHGLKVEFKPSKILGRTTKIVWDQIHEILLNLQFLNTKRLKMTSVYYDTKGGVIKEDYKTQPFENILAFKNMKNSLLTDKTLINIEDKNITEDIGGKRYKRFISMDIAFTYTTSDNPYIDSFCNMNNTIDNGSHLDASIEGMCRYFQQVTKSTLTERDKLDIKWDDVKTGLSIVVALRTNMEEIFTSQTKHKVSNDDLEKLIKDLTIETLNKFFTDNPGKLKEFIGVVKTNAKARREGDKARNAVVKETMTNWGQYKLKSYDPCTNKGKSYRELYIVEGDSAKGSLKIARDPKFQALFAIRGVSANVFKLDLTGVLANKEFNDLIKIMGCNIGQKFDMSKLAFDKIIIASDADVDGLFIRSLLCSFYFKIYPEIIQDGRLFIAEPPLYRVDDKKDPFVINKEDYVQRYIKLVVKDYTVGYADGKEIEFFNIKNKDDLAKFDKLLADTSSYVDDIHMLSDHYKINDRLMEMIIEEFAFMGVKDTDDINEVIKSINIQRMMNRIGEEFDELSFDDNDKIIKGIINGKYQTVELSERLVRKSIPLCKLIQDYGPTPTRPIVLKNNKTGTEEKLSLLALLKVLQKYQPPILHRFKGLGENDSDDIKTTIMDPNTRTLIRVQIGDIVNDMKVFQMLRGNSPLDAKNRKNMMRAYKIDRNDIDT